STNDLAEDGIAPLAERAVAMARAAPEDPFAGLAERARLAKTFPDLDLVDPELPSVERLEALALAAEAAAVAGRGVTEPAGASPARWFPTSARRATARRSRGARASCRTSSASKCSAPPSAFSTIRCGGAGCARGRSMRKASPGGRSRWSRPAC